MFDVQNSSSLDGAAWRSETPFSALGDTSVGGDNTNSHKSSETKETGSTFAELHQLPMKIATMQTMPGEALALIFVQYDDPRILSLMRRVCCSLRAAAEDDKLWEKLCRVYPAISSTRESLQGIRGRSGQLRDQRLFVSCAILMRPLLCHQPISLPVVVGPHGDLSLSSVTHWISLDCGGASVCLTSTSSQSSSWSQTATESATSPGSNAPSPVR